MTKQQVPDNVDAATGEIVDKPYNTSQHTDFPREVLGQFHFVQKYIRNPKDPDAFSKLDLDTLSMVLFELTAYYESTGKWLADQKLYVNDLKLARDFKYDDTYLAYKQRKSETNETARMQARMACHVEDERIVKAQHDYDRVETWHKSVSHWRTSVVMKMSADKKLLDFH